MTSNYKQLSVWKLGMSLIKDIHELTYQETNSVIDSEKFNILNEIKVCAHSIPSSIAKGAEYKSSQKFLSYLKIANSASIELDSKLRIAKDLGEIANKNLKDILEKIEKLQKMLILLRKPLEI